MTLLQITVKPLTKKVLEKATVSIAGSIAYNKLMVGFSGMNIVYNRLNFDENCFDKHKIGDSYYMTVNPKVSKSHRLFDIYHWLQCAADEIQKRFLKQLYIVFQDKNTKVILEKYKFDITYDPTDDGTTLPRGSSVIKMTVDFFNKIHNLKQIDVLNAEDIEFGLQIITNDNSPIDYVPPFFERGVYFNVRKESSDYYLVGAVSTSFHDITLGCCINMGNGRHFSSKRICRDPRMRKEAEKANKRLKIIAEIESEEDANNRTMDCTFASDEMNCINCTCHISLSIKLINLIKCEKCNVLQHITCQGFLNKPATPYHCLKCIREENLDVPDYRTIDYKLSVKNMTVKSFVRLFCYICYKSGKAPMFLFTHISKALKKTVDKILIQTKVVTKEGDKYIPNVQKIQNNILPNYFNEREQHDNSMTLIGNQESENLI